MFRKAGLGHLLRARHREALKANCHEPGRLSAIWTYWVSAQKPVETSVDNVFVLFTRYSLGRPAPKELFLGQFYRP